MMKLFSLLCSEVVADEGRRVGDCHDLRQSSSPPRSGSPRPSSVGEAGSSTSASVRTRAPRRRVRDTDTVPWTAVLRIEGDRIVVHDEVDPR
jgi:sporulation protein YlmC with PRC-barrel domain